MASGVNSNFVINCGDGFYFRVRYHEDYDVTSNLSTVYVDGVDCMAGVSYYEFYPDGKIYIDGQCVKTLDSRIPTGETSTIAHEWTAISSTSGSKSGIQHNSDGSRSISITLAGNRYDKFYMFREGTYSGWGTYTVQTVQLTTIPRSSQPSCITYPDNTQNVGDIGSSFYIHTNRKSSAFTHTISYTFGSLSGTIGTNVTDNIQWTIPMDFCNQVTSATSGAGTITCVTYNGSIKIGTRTCSFTCSVPSSIVPTISNLSYALDNSANSTINGWGVAVSGFTKVKLTASASGVYGSTISSYTITGAYSTSVSGSTLNYTGGKITSSGTKTFKVCAVDTRGRKSEVMSVSVSVLSYSAPTLSNFTVARNSSVATSIDVSFSKKFSSVGGNNVVTATLKYKKRSSDGWITYGTVDNGSTLSDNLTTEEVEFDEALSYDFQLVLKDSIGNSASATSMISTLSVLLDFKAGGKGLGIGKISEIDKGVEVNSDWDFYIHGEEIATTIGNAKESAISTAAEYMQEAKDYAKDYVDAYHTSYYFSYSPSESTIQTNDWYNITGNKATISDVLTGLYLITCAATINSTDSGVATCRWVIDGTEFANNRSRATAPTANGFKSTFNVSFIWNAGIGTSFKDVCPQVYSNVTFTVESAFIGITKLMEDWTSM